jgi:subtilisin family serine protease
LRELKCEFLAERHSEVEEETIVEETSECEGDHEHRVRKEHVTRKEVSDERVTGKLTELARIGDVSAESVGDFATALARYAETVPVPNWPTLVMELDDNADFDDVAEQLECAGFRLGGAGDTQEEESAKSKLRLFGMLHFSVPPEYALIESLARLRFVRCLYDGDASVRIPEPQPLKPNVAEARLSSCVRMVLNEDELPKGFPKQRGKGVTIGIVDTGIDDTHADLEGRVRAHKSFVPNELDVADLVGHGTHVAGIAAGTGAASKGDYAGVAPHAELVSAKVLGQMGGTTTSVVSGVVWAIDNGASVLNLSIGGPGATDGQGLLARACEKAVRAGVCVVISAGNSGPERETVTTPGDTPSAATVGAIDRDENVADFSSRGPTNAPDSTGPKPNVVAPGVAIVAPLSHCADDLVEYSEARGYTVLSGTSMAAPHVTGAVAAILGYVLERKEELPAKDLLELCAERARKLSGFDDAAQGQGLIDTAAVAVALSGRGVGDARPARASAKGLATPAGVAGQAEAMHERAAPDAERTAATSVAGAAEAGSAERRVSAGRSSGTRSRVLASVLGIVALVVLSFLGIHFGLGESSGGRLGLAFSRAVERLVDSESPEGREAAHEADATDTGQRAVGGGLPASLNEEPSAHRVGEPELAVYLEAKVLYASGDYVTALEVLEVAMREPSLDDDGMGWIEYYVASSLARGGDYFLGLAGYDAFIETREGHPAVWRAHCEKMQLLVALGHFDAAEAVAEEALMLHEDNPEAVAWLYMNYARIFARLGDEGKAEEILQTVARLPDSEPVREAAALLRELERE